MWLVFVFMFFFRGTCVFDSELYWVYFFWRMPWRVWKRLDWLDLNLKLSQWNLIPITSGALTFDFRNLNNFVGLPSRTLPVAKGYIIAKIQTPALQHSKCRPNQNSNGQSAKRCGPDMWLCELRNLRYVTYSTVQVTEDMFMANMSECQNVLLCSVRNASHGWAHQAQIHLQFWSEKCIWLCEMIRVWHWKDETWVTVEVDLTFCKDHQITGI